MIRSPAGRDDDPIGRSAPPGSLPIRMVETMLRHPVTSGGVLLSLTMIGVIFGNALGNQPLRHPHPWFETRAAAPASVPLPGPLPALPPVPLPQAAPGLAPAPAALPAPAAIAPNTPPALPRPRPIGALDQPGNLRDLQVALREHGLYAGALDGVLGPATVEAIRAFERSIGAPVTGEPSDLLLAAARALHPAVPATTASTPPQPQRRVEAQPVAAPVAAVDTSMQAAPTPSMRIAMADAVAHPVGENAVVDLPMVEEVEPPVFTGSIRRAAREPLAPGGDGRLQKVQRGLIAAGYGPLKADGRWDERSSSAVRRFEADRGWPVTGRPTARLVSALSDEVPAAHR
jgi:peptidoglycan hydrolase-like protein with peptidoglycan-binding domain